MLNLRLFKYIVSQVEQLSGTNTQPFSDSTHLLPLLTCVNDVRCMSSRRRWCSVRVGEGRVDRDPASRRTIREGGSVGVGH